MDSKCGADHCIECGAALGRHYDPPIPCEACEVSGRYEARIAKDNEMLTHFLQRLDAILDEMKSGLPGGEAQLQDAIEQFRRYRSQSRT